MSARSPRLLAAGLVAMAVASGAPARAQTPSERALSESLFREGKRLLGKGEIAAACRKLEESYRLDPVGGTLLNLATCHEKEGRLAAAWAEYQSSLELARRAGRKDRIALAERKVNELASRVALLTIQVNNPPPGLVVELDGVPLGAGSMGTALAVDPGEHRVTARATGRVPHESTLTLSSGQNTTIAVQELAMEKRPATARTTVAPAPTEDGEEGSWMRPTSYALGGVSVIGLAIGSVAGIVALGKAGDAERGCRGGLCDAASFAAHEDGRDAATLSTVGFVVGLVAGAGAVTVFLLAPEHVEDGASTGARPHGGARRDVASVTPLVGPTALGGSVRVRWP